ncbi:response regulator [Mesorhizobium sp. CO1-1-8]|uniref:response regulator n=1 Tax=Mesorhizobium sp. CO1-1-8 TaxID=2876631 RepID=UPI001CD16EC3|nr:response regulator [Mesorhizobium sp. CO1-1-8]MBZ9774998.1 response regulator [Mesorhizobium sp. CO1-1-8]
MTKPRVLLVEDETLIAMLTEEMLVDLGYDVVANVATLEAGLRAAAATAIDVAVLDINLRGSMSFPIADLLAERGVPYLFASGYTAQGIERRHVDAPALQKPFTAEGLAAILTKTINGKSLTHKQLAVVKSAADDA